MSRLSEKTKAHCTVHITNKLYKSRVFANRRLSSSVKNTENTIMLVSSPDWFFQKFVHMKMTKNYQSYPYIQYENNEELPILLVHMKITNNYQSYPYIEDNEELPILPIQYEDNE